MDVRMVFSNSLLLDWMLEVGIQYVTLLDYIFFISLFSYYNHINFSKCDDISVILEFSVILYL